MRNANRSFLLRSPRSCCQSAVQHLLKDSRQFTHLFSFLMCSKVLMTPWSSSQICLAYALSMGAPDRIDVSFRDRKSTRLNSSHVAISYAVFCLKKKQRTHT